MYALGVGSCASDAVDADELKYVYHENGQQFIQVFDNILLLFSVSVVVDSLCFNPLLCAIFTGLAYVCRSGFS